MGVHLGLYKNNLIGYSLALLKDTREPRGRSGHKNATKCHGEKDEHG